MRRVLLAGATLACGVSPARRGRTVIYASGADLQSVNPLFTTHPLAKQVQRYVLLTTLARYDSALVPQPYLARRWTWSAERTTLTFRLQPGVRWHDGVATTARDVVWTLNTACDSVTGYPRLSDLANVVSANDADDSTVIVRFSRPERELPDVFTDLAVLPAHLLDSIPRTRLRQAEWNAHPVGNGPFRFVTHESNRRWVFAANPTFPPALGGPPQLARFIVVVVDEPTTKLAALTVGEIDFAGIQPAHAAFVRRNPDLAVLDYPLIYPYGIVFNTRRPPFDDARVRRAVALALDRREIVDGYLYGLLTVGSGEAPLEQMIQARLAGVGVRASIRQLELSAFLDRVNPRRHDFDAAVVGTAGDPGLGYLSQLADLAGLRAPADPATAQRLFRDSLPIAFLYHARGVQGMNRRVQ